MNSNFMTQLPQYQLKSLVKQITHEKGAVTKEQRLNACEQLQKVLLELHDSRNMNCDPRSMLFELDVLFCTRISYDVKKAVAACIGTIGYIMAYKFKDFLTWLMENVRRAGEKQEDVKALYLRSLSTTFDLDKRQRRLDDESISATMTEVRTIMETNDYASILLPLLDISSTIADVYPIIFKPSFEDIVDVIIGWYVDIEQPSEVFEQCESTIKSFRRFWLQNISVGKELLKHFLDDAEGYVEEVRESKKTDTAPEDALLKSAALLRALTTILVAMGSDLTAIQLMQFIDEAILPRLVRCVDGTINVTYLEAADVLAAVAECVGAAIEVSRSTSTVQSGFDLIVRILLEAQLSPSNLVAVIQFFTKVSLFFFRFCALL
uniref:Uncharacterized protein n=1 Tax=Plectus sambesii TaxID=2011161 RepID=A0A914WFQ7_9BILA